MGNSKYQKFTVETISRADIKNAEYNPRIMDKEAKKRLKKGLQQHGLVSAITWNKRTGNLVGGHQRLEQLDALEKNKEYTLDVCVIDVDEKEEAILNVQLNNPSMQGDWDLDKLAGITEEFDLNFEEMGFTKLDIDFMYDGDERFTELADTEERKQSTETLQAIKDFRAESKEKYKENNNMNWYTVIVFTDEKEKADFHKKINISQYEKYITAEQVMRLAND